MLNIHVSLDSKQDLTLFWGNVFQSLFLCPCRQTDLEALASSLQQYRDGHSALIKWIEETTERQENAQPGQTDSRALAEQLAQQTVSVSGGGGGAAGFGNLGGQKCNFMDLFQESNIINWSLCFDCCFSPGVSC